MTYQQPYPPQYPQPQHTPTPARPKPAGFAVTALVLGIIGVVLSFMPIVNNLTAAGAVVGLVFGVIGLWKSRLVMSAIGAFLCGLAVILTIVAQQQLVDELDKIGDDIGPISSARPASDGIVTVLYEVEGTTDYADVTMETPTGTSQISPDVPMTRKSDGQRGLEMEFSSGDFVYLAAQNKRGHGTVTCRITVDGEVISENSGSGGYAIATCDGTAR